MDKPTLSKILNGRTPGFSTDKLAVMLNSLGRNVTVVVEGLGETNETWERGRAAVVVEQDRADEDKRVRKKPLVA